MQISEQGKRLPKSVEIRSFNRPVKVVFLVPIEENQISHWILDGIFYEAYSRWGGAHSLIIPFQDGRPLHDNYMPWLSCLDPDFVYSFVEIDEQMISEINQQVMPIEMIKHEIVGEPERWRQFIPKWPYGFKPVRSISTLTSPYANYPGWLDKPSPQVYITQSYEEDEERFLPNNFGVAHDISTVTYGQSGIFETMCYCAKNIPENNIVGNYRSDNLTELMEKLTTRQLRTFSRLATIHSDGISHPSDRVWINGFHLFIGDTVNDRLHFWNSRHLSGSSATHNIDSLIVSPSQIEEDDFCHQLGQFLNRHNYKSSNNGPAQTNIRSFSIEKGQCQAIADKLQPLTWNSVSVTNDFNCYAVPDPIRCRDHYPGNGMVCPSFKVNESCHSHIAHEPEHFQYLTPNFFNAKQGQWLVELQIERHQDDCHYGNVYNDWKLPRRHEIVRAFTKNMGKVDISSNLVVIPSVPEHFQLGSHQNHDNKIHLSFPDDENIFRVLVVNIPAFNYQDMRSCLNRDNKYEDIKISDKGQNHRGVISLFEGDTNQASILTNLYWRRIIRETNSNPGKMYSMDKLISFINEFTQIELENLTQQMRFKNQADSKNFLRENLKDTVEYLVHNGVLQKIHFWRCTYCGNSNKRSLDTLKLENLCDICQKSYQTPIDMEWKYSVSPFVVASLAEHNGLTVLWGIAKLFEESRLRQSIYVPEIDLYRVYDDEDQKNEIDLIALIDGKFVAAEMKMSAASFVESEREADTFVDEITRIQPDIAYLIFEQYCNNNDDEQEIIRRLGELIEQLKTRIAKTTELKVMIAITYPDFSGVPIEIGYYGNRTRRMIDTLKY